MSEQKDLPPPPSYEEAQKFITPSAPPSGPGQPVGYGAYPPQPTHQSAAYGGGYPPPAGGYPPHPGGYPPQPYSGAGYQQPGQYSTGPMQPQYPTPMTMTGVGYNPQQGTTYPVAAAGVVAPGYNTTPAAYGTTSAYDHARRRKIICFVVFFVVFIVVFLSILFNVILRW